MALQPQGSTRVQKYRPASAVRISVFPGKDDKVPRASLPKEDTLTSIERHLIARDRPPCPLQGMTHLVVEVIRSIEHMNTSAAMAIPRKQ